MNECRCIHPDIQWIDETGAVTKTQSLCRACGLFVSLHTIDLIGRGMIDIPVDCFDASVLDDLNVKDA